MFYYHKNVSKKNISIIENIVKNYHINFDILIINTKSKTIYGEAIFYETGNVIIKINFSLGDIEDTLMHELAHCITREHKHNLNWRKTYRKLKEIHNG